MFEPQFIARDPVNRLHGLNKGCVAWWLATPQRAGGASWYDLMSGIPAGLVGFGSTIGWKPSTRAGGHSHLLCSTSANYTSATAPNGSPLDITGTKISLGAWVYPTVSNVFQTIVAKTGGATTRQYGLYLSGSGTSSLFVAFQGSATFTGAGAGLPVSTPWAVNAWNHIYVTWDGTSARPYVNGVQAGATAGAGSITNVSGSNIYMGYDNPAANFGLSGPVDDARIYNRVLTLVEIQSLYRESLNGYPNVLSRNQPYLQSEPIVLAKNSRRTNYIRAGSRGVA